MSDAAPELMERYLRQMKRRGVKAVRVSAETRALMKAAAPVPAAPVAAPAAAAPVRTPPPAARPAPPVAAPVRTAAPAPAPARSVAPVRPAPVVEEVRIDLPAGDRATKIAALQQIVLPCQKCPNLVSFRHHVVFGVGNPEASLMFVGEAPGADEDLQGEPFVGKAGQLLTKMIEAMGLKRSDVYIANVLKCRPDMPPGSTGNRQPTAKEMATCLPYLRKQVEVIQPKVMVALGLTAVKGLLGVDDILMGKVRGTWQDFAGIPVMPTYHPAYLLRNQAVSEKRKVWEDLLAAMERLEMPISEKQRGFFLKG
jgi:DNA polymerase